jgi:hypothetical protein
MISKKIFIHSNNFPETNSFDSLNEYIENNKKLDPYYIAIQSSKYHINVKNWIESMWLKYKQYAERGFDKKIRVNTQFHPFTWQLLLGSIFIDKQYKILKTKEKGPDLCVLIDNKKIWIEAVTTNKGESIDQDKVGDFGKSDNIYDSFKIPVSRITNTIEEKYNKYYDEYLSKGIVRKICDMNEPFILAIPLDKYSS